MALSEDYERVAETIRYIDAHFKEQPGLAQVADHVGLSEFHFQRLFRRWAGISPKRFLQFLTAEYACEVLSQTQDVFDATYQSGLSGPARLHDLFVNIYAATPAQVRDAGRDLVIRYGFVDSPFGDCLIAQTERGLCGLGFATTGHNDAISELKARWSSATLIRDDAQAGAATARVFGAAPFDGDRPLSLFVTGTNFQIRVWEALLRIPFGMAATYADLARTIGAPGAARAVGSAVGENPVAYVIPCHRVLRKSGAFGGYRWGADRKRAMLGWEAASASNSRELAV